MDTTRPPELLGGERLKPWLNGLLRLVLARTTIRGGAGLDVRQTDAGTTLSLRPGLVRSVDALLTCASGPDTPLPPSDVKYTARGIGEEASIRITEPRVPDFGRPVRGDAVKVYPHRNETRCRILIRPDPDHPGKRITELEVPAEAINFGACPPAAADAAPASDGGDCGCSGAGHGEPGTGHTDHDCGCGGAPGDCGCHDEELMAGWPLALFGAAVGGEGEKAEGE